MSTVSSLKATIKGSRVTREQASCRNVELLADIQGQFGRDFFADDCFCLFLQDSIDPEGIGDRFLGEGPIGDVLLLLLSKLDKEPLPGWSFEYYGRQAVQDGSAIVSVTPNNDEQRFYIITAA